MIRQILIASLLVAATASAFAAPQKYDIDTNHTYVTFTYNHFGFSNPVGKLEKISGDLQLDTADLTKSTVSVAFPLDGLHTGVPKLDDHMRSPDFFDAAKYPDITFKSTKVEKTGTDALRISGEMSAHGVTKPVVLDVRINKIGDNPMNKLPSAGFEADTTIKRSDFGVDKYAPGVSDEVKVHISLDSHQAKP